MFVSSAIVVASSVVVVGNSVVINSVVVSGCAGANNIDKEVQVLLTK